MFAYRVEQLATNARGAIRRGVRVVESAISAHGATVRAATCMIPSANIALRVLNTGIARSAFDVGFNFTCLGSNIYFQLLHIFMSIDSNIK